MDLSQKKWIWISIGFSVVVLVIVLASTLDQNTLEYLKQANPVFLILAVGLRLCSLLFWSLRVKMMSHALGYKVKLSNAWNLVLANLLVGAITPGQAGGEPVRIHELYKDGVNLGDATAIVIMERVLDGTILVLMGVLSIGLLGSVIPGISISLIIAMVISWIFMGGLIILLFMASRKPDKVKQMLLRLLHWLDRKIHRASLKKTIGRVDAELDNFFVSINLFTGPARRGLVTGGFFSLLFWISEFFVASLILMGLGLSPYVLESFLFQLIIAVVMMLPLTPGSSGIAEISATSLYALIVPSSLLGIFVLLWRLILYYLNIILGLWPSLNIFRREMARKSEEPGKDPKGEG